MGIISAIFGKSDAKKADALASAADVGAALARLVSEREEAKRIIHASMATRRELLLVDGSDREIKKLDEAVDAAHLTLERLDLIEPTLHARLRDFQDSARRQRLAELEAKYRDFETVLDGAIAVAADAFADYRAIIGELDAEGFSAEARGFVVAPPSLAGGVVCGADPLESWRAERDRVTALRGRIAANMPLASVAPSISPEQAAKNIAARKPAARPVASPEYRPAPSRAPISCNDAPAFGFSKIVVIRTGLEIGGAPHLAGDELIVSNFDAEALLRAGAVDLVERGEVVTKAAE